MEGETINAYFSQLINVLARVGHVEVAVKVSFGHLLSDPGNNGGTNCKVRHEMSKVSTFVPIHDIDVERLSSNVNHLLTFLGEISEVC